jgi:hypothetical protein
MPENKSSSLDTLRVIGSPQGFAVYDNARRKLNVMALDLFIRPGNAPLMQIAMPAGNIDVVGKALFAIVDVATGKPRVVKRIEWADGEHTDFPEPEKAESVVNSANVPSGNGQGEAAGAPVGAEQENVQADAARLMGDA